MKTLLKSKLKILAICLLGASFMGASSLSHGASEEVEGSISAISSVSITDNSSIAVSGADSTTGVGNTLSGDQFITLTIANNNNAGYDVDVSAENGKLVVSGSDLGTKEGLEINYTLSCDSYSDAAGTSVSVFEATDLAQNTSVEVYSHDSPQEATVNQTPHCDLAVSSDDIEEKFSGTYQETFTFTITNDGDGNGND